MGKGGSGKTKVTDYRMSMHWGVCANLDALLGIFYGEKAIWEGEQTSNGQIAINQLQLFGGPLKEGGVSGTAEFLNGNPAQTMPEALAARLGRTTATCPAFRGIASVFFRGTDSSYAGSNGFLWGSNNPYLRDIWFRGRRTPKGLSAERQTIDVGDGRKNANPAAIIYECLTDPDFGLGGDSSGVDLASFNYAADVLLTEKLGMSLRWTRQSAIEDFVQEILDHIQGMLFINPRNGLWTQKLIRGDYDPNDLPVIDEDVCEVTAFDRKGFGETTNEIVVSWTNPETEESETVNIQDLGNIAIQGEMISTSRNYYGFRSAETANFVARRDMATASAPLATFEIEIDRSAWAFLPGDCIKLNYPSEGISGLVLRIGQIDYGKPGDGVIKISAVEDVFSLPVAAYTAPPESEWQDPSQDPNAIGFARIITAPAYFLLANGAAPLTYPEVKAAVLAASTNPDASSYDLVAQNIQPNGSYVGTVIGNKPTLGHGALQAALSPEVTSTVSSFGTITGATIPQEGGFLFIGATAEEHQEIAMISAIADGNYTLKRGCFDTVPKAWSIGTPVWFVARTTNFIDDSEIRAEGEDARYKLLTRTSLGVLPASAASIVGTTLLARPHMPQRPGNVKVDGVAFGSLDVSASPPSTLSVTWGNRNRTVEDNVVVLWDDGTVTPEASQTTTVSVRKTDGTLLTAHTGLTGTSFSLPLTSFGSEEVADVVVTSARSGLLSLQGHSIRVRVAGSGSIPDPAPPPSGGGGDPVPGGGFVDPGGVLPEEIIP